LGLHLNNKGLLAYNWPVSSIYEYQIGQWIEQNNCPALGDMSVILIVLFHLDRNLNQQRRRHFKTIKILICL